MQYRVYNRQTLKYVDGGYVQTWEIDDDYIVNNNSTISVVKKKDSSLSDVVVGDIIALIEDSGAYHKGVITAVDDTDNTISYKSDKELFNDNIPNPYMTEFASDSDLEMVGKFGIDIVIALLKHYFANENTLDNDYDPLKNLPITFVADGDVLDDTGSPKMLWTWSNDSINVVDWLTELFEKYNLSLSWDIDFDISKDLTVEEKYGENNPNARHPQYVVTLSAIVKSGGIVKDNVAMQTITYTVKELPDATVCYVIDSSTKELVYVSSGVNLLNPATAKENTVMYIDENNNIVTTSRDGTNLSSYITVDLNQKYTLCHQAYPSTTERFIIVYNSKKEILGYYSYSQRVFTFGSNDEDAIKPTPTAMVEENGTKRRITVAELIANAKYIKVNYYSSGAWVQLEKGDTETKYDSFSTPAIFYLREKDGEYSVSIDKEQKLEDGRERVLPVKTVLATYSVSSDGTDETSPENVATDKLIPSQFNQAIEIRISADSKMFDFQNAKFGDQYQIINELGSVNSVYTGLKVTSDNKWVTLYFGLGRQNYTDLIQLKMRKSRYTEIYNQS